MYVCMDYSSIRCICMYIFHCISDHDLLLLHDRLQQLVAETDEEAEELIARLRRAVTDYSEEG